MNLILSPQMITSGLDLSTDARGTENCNSVQSYHFMPKDGGIPDLPNSRRNTMTRPWGRTRSGAWFPAEGVQDLLRQEHNDQGNNEPAQEQ